MIEYKKNLIIFVFLFLILSFPIGAEGEDIYVDIELGECTNIDVNGDDFADIIVCYNEDETITVDNIVFVDFNLESILEDDINLILPTTFTEITEYSFSFDEEQFRSEIKGEYMIYIYGLSVLISGCILFIAFLFSKRIKSKHRKKN